MSDSTALYLLFLCVVFIGGVYFFCRKREIDFLTITFFSALLYAIPAFFGNVTFNEQYAYFSASFHNIHYVLLVFYFLMIPVVDLIVPNFIDYSGDTHKSDFELFTVGKQLWFPSFLLSFTAGVALLIQNPMILQDSNKLEWMRSLGHTGVVFQHSCIQTLVFAGLTKSRNKIVVSFFWPILETFWGNRESAIIGGIAMFISLYYGRKIKLVNHWKLILGALLLIIIVIVYKKMQMYLKIGDWDGLRWMLFERGDLFELFVFKMEQFKTILLFIQPVQIDFRLDETYVLQQFIVLIPFASFIGFSDPNSFNHYVQGPLLNISSSDIGLASSNWGEWYSVAGWPSFVFFTIVFLLFLKFLSQIRHFKQFIPLLIQMGCFFGFFIYRTDLGTQFNILKRMIITYLIILLFYQVVLFFKKIRHTKP